MLEVMLGKVNTGIVNTIDCTIIVDIIYYKYQIVKLM